MDTSRVVIVRPRSGWARLDLGELLRYRELLWVLIWRDVKVRYKQTAIGAAWAVLQPFLTMVVFSLLFGRLAGIPSEGLPYPLFAYAGLLPWQFFSKALAEASTSLVQNERMIGKIYFPRVLIPSAVVLSGLVDLGIALLVLVGMMAYYGVSPDLAVLSIPLFMALAVMTALGVALLLSALDVEYRDVRYVLPFLTQIWLFATPVAYPSTLIPEAWQTIYGLNPMVGVVQGFRWAFLGGTPPDLGGLAASVSAVGLVFVCGLVYFRRVQGTIADRL